MKTLLKHSPLKGIYEKRNAKLVEVNNWSMAESFLSANEEKEALNKASILVDWSHVGKISISGTSADKTVESVVAGVKNVENGKSLVQDDLLVLRHLDTAFTILTLPSKEEELMEQFKNSPSNVINLTGANGCLILAGSKRDEIMERSTAMNLRRDIYPIGSVIQSSVHTITTTIYRMENAEMLICSRSYCESLFDGMWDMGKERGMKLAGLSTLPISFS